MTDGELDAVTARLATARADVLRADSRREDRALLVDEVLWTVDVLELAVDDARARLAGENTIASVPQMQRDALARRLTSLRERYRTLWLARNRSGGLTDSLAWIDNLCDAYETGQPDPTWGGWPAQYS
jgi:hypothetical protein